MDDATQADTDGDTPRQPTAPVDLPQQLRERYDARELLGQGGLGMVVAAWDRELQRNVAIKLLSVRRDTETRAATAAERMLAEARALAQVSHPNVVQIFDVGRSASPDPASQVYLVMEALAGPDLAQWLQAEQPTGEILRRFVAAAHGLAAAHAAGIVHRDFKPANVVLDARGVAKVVDFGIARTDGSPSADAETVDPDGVVASDSTQGRLTEVGVVMGTPRYMAPEQHAGADVGPAADQYAWCVALWEALRGQPVFGGQTVESLAGQKRAGEVADVADEDRTPSRLAPILRRGISPEPGDRWPSMTELIVAVDRAASGPRWPSLMLAGLGATAVVAAFAWPHATACPTVETVVSPEVRRSLLDAVARGGAPMAAIAEVEGQLERQGRLLSAGYEAACTARDEGDLAPARFDRRIACLRNVSDEWVSATQVLSEADALTAPQVLGSLSSLPPASGCADDDALARSAKPPRPQQAKLVAALQADLRRAIALQDLGHSAESKRIADSIALRAADLDYPPLHVRLQLLRAGQARFHADHEAAAAHFRKALSMASEHGLDTWAAKAAVGLTSAASGVQDDDRAMSEAAAATALIERAGNPPRLRIDLLLVLGGMHLRKREADEAVATLREALALVDELSSPDPKLRSLIMGNLGSSLRRAGKLEESAQMLEAALTLRAGLLGDDHPKLAVLVGNLGHTRLEQGRIDEAVSSFRRQLDLLERSEERIRLPSAWIGLGVALKKQGKFEEAKQAYETALKTAEEELGPDDPLAAMAVRNLANLYKRMGDDERALEYAKQALRATEHQYGDQHPATAEALFTVGHVQRKLGDLDAARDSYERSLQIRDALEGVASSRVPALLGLASTALDAGDLVTAQAHFAAALAEPDDDAGTAPLVDYGRARIAMKKGEPAEAEPRLRRALVYFESSGEARNDTPSIRALWAQALWGTGKHDEARREAKRALDEMPPGDEHDALAAWLDDPK